MDGSVQIAKTAVGARLRAAAAHGTLSHALILSGSGDRLGAARYAAAALECTAPVRPCLCCAHCRKVLADIHPDVTTVCDSEHAELSADVIRSVRTGAFVRPNEGAVRVFIFPDCSLLNEKDQNILLKTVEEGPDCAAFVFCAENSAVLLPTVRSRCVELKLSAPQRTETVPEGAEELARLIVSGSRVQRTAYLVALELKKPERETLAALLGGVRALLAGALAAQYGAVLTAERDRAVAELSSRLTKQQIIGTIELLETYRLHCDYNVGIGPLLGGLAAELEEIL